MHCDHASRDRERRGRVSRDFERCGRVSRARGIRDRGNHGHDGEKVQIALSCSAKPYSLKFRT